MNRFARHSFKAEIFYNCTFFKFTHIYIIFYHSKYRLINFLISRRLNDVICINKHANELSFSCWNEFNLYPNFPFRPETFEATLVHPSLVNIISKKLSQLNKTLSSCFKNKHFMNPKTFTSLCAIYIFIFILLWSQLPALLDNALPWYHPLQCLGVALQSCLLLSDVLFLSQCLPVWLSSQSKSPNLPPVKHIFINKSHLLQTELCNMLCHSHHVVHKGRCSLW